MNYNKELKQILLDEFGSQLSNVIYQTDKGTYEVFHKYHLILEKSGWRVFCSATDVGIFTSTKTAVSWCIADKYKKYNLARDIFNLDTKLSSLINDIDVRARIGDKSKGWLFKETIGTKLETKIIHKKKLENDLTICINQAKYLQQQGFNNETVRTIRSGTFKTSR